MIEGCDGVPAPGYRDKAAVLRQRRGGPRQGDRRRTEGRRLEPANRTVPGQGTGGSPGA